jgi:hypothetical protein
MPLREELLKRKESFTGFLVTYADGSKVYEKENYFSKRLNKKCATNWSEIDRSKISSLELLWNGANKAIINKVSTSDPEIRLEAKDWFFSHRGYLDMGTRKIKIISRNIGYIKDNILYITSIVEDTGEITRSIRAAT